MSDTLDADLEARAEGILRLLAKERRDGGPRDPELRSNLGRLYTAIRDTQRLRRAEPMQAQHEEELRRLLLTPKELETLNSDAVGLLMETVDQVLVEAGDDKLLDGMLATERVRDANEREGPVPTWSALQSCEWPTELPDKKRQLASLLRARASIYALRRAREGARADRLTWLAPILVVLVGVFIALTDWVADAASWREGVLVAVAGALGATLAAAFNLRDALARLSELRTFWNAFALQMALGAVAGLFLWMVLESGLVEVAGSSEDEWAVSVAVAFVAGFSEPFVLGTIARIAGDGDAR